MVCCPAVCCALPAVWELLTGELPFRGMLEGDLVVGVCDRKLRPVFPPGAPAAYVALAQQCWSEDAAERPTAAQVRAGVRCYALMRGSCACLQCVCMGCVQSCLVPDNSAEQRLQCGLLVLLCGLPRF
jgi:hypothetical protein